VRRVVITGAAGLIGGVLRRALSERYDLSGIDKRRAIGVARIDMLNLRAVEKAFQGADAVVDLAGIAQLDIPWELVLKNNIAATTNALLAVESVGVRRFVFASSNHVTGGYEREWPYSAIVAGEYDGLERAEIPMIDASTPLRPDSPYAVGKLFGEAAARYHAASGALTAICLRLGTVNGENRPLAPRHYATWLSHGDLARLVAAAIEAPETLEFGVYYGVSDNTWRFWDVAQARAEIAFEPEDDAERFRGE
jgi:nucleoside-diphosphate-sugar epimerase